MFVLGLVAFWALATQHCRLEVVPGLDFLACLSPETEAHHESSDCESDGCANVESSLYKSENHRITLEQPPLLAAPMGIFPYLALACLPSNQACAPLDNACLGRPSGLFLLRNVVSPRAPSPVS